MSHLGDLTWQGRTIIWKRPETWMPALTLWIAPFLRKDFDQRIKPGIRRDLCWDDSEWLDIVKHSLHGDFDEVLMQLGDELLDTKIRVHHACRTADAGVYFREGLLRRNRERLRAVAVKMIEEHEELRYYSRHLDTAIDRLNPESDEGRSFVALDDKVLLQEAGHYLIHGSEWLMSVFDHKGRQVLKGLGAPTIIEMDLPAEATHAAERERLGSALLSEWARYTCNGFEFTAPIDVTFTLVRDVPPSCVVGHYHPTVIVDPHDGMTEYRPAVTTCKKCQHAS